MHPLSAAQSSETQSCPIQRFASIPPNTKASGDIESMSLLAGQSVGLVSEIRPAADVIREVVDGAESLILRLGACRLLNARGLLTAELSRLIS